MSEIEELKERINKLEVEIDRINQGWEIINSILKMHQDTIIDLKED